MRKTKKYIVINNHTHEHSRPLTLTDKEAKTLRDYCYDNHYDFEPYRDLLMTEEEELCFINMAAEWAESMKKDH